jgi:hypothetical protein
LEFIAPPWITRDPHHHPKAGKVEDSLITEDAVQSDTHMYVISTFC